jgi:putative oxidoreductase
MKKVVFGARILLGLTFVVFGLNGFLQFIKQPPPTAVALQFLGALISSHEIAVVMLLEVVGGVLLLANLFVPLALVLLAPVVVNIVLFHAFMAPSGLPVALITAVLWVLTASGVREAFGGLLKPQTTTEERA